MARDVFQRYLKLARRALADAAATAAAAAAGISTQGAPLRPLAELIAAMEQQEQEGSLPVGAGAASGGWAGTVGAAMPGWSCTSTKPARKP